MNLLHQLSYNWAKIWDLRYVKTATNISHQFHILHRTNLYNLLHYFHYIFYKMNVYMYSNHIVKYSLLPGSSVTDVFVYPDTFPQCFA